MKTFSISLMIFFVAKVLCSMSLDDLPQKEQSNINLLSDSHKLSRDRYVWGGITGTVLGFGIGHAIQERYKEKGWIFTLTDALGVGTILGGYVDLNIRYREHGKTGDASVGTVIPGLIIAGVGVAVLFGFRIWQAIDLWTVN